MTFKIGDSVRVVTNCPYHKFRNMCGKICAKRRYDFGVDFGKDVGGHTCDDSCDKNCGWYFTEEDIKLNEWCLL